MASVPDDPDPAAKSGTGVLSRTSLYTPLSFYTSQRNSAANNANMKQQQQQHQQHIAKNVQDASLVEFMAKNVSTAYHYSSRGRNNNKKDDDSSKDSNSHHSVSQISSVLSVKHARNTGNRPLTVGEINGRIRQRALTLVGGGYNVSVDGVNGAGSGATAKQAMNGGGGVHKRSAASANSRTNADRQQRRQRKRRKKTATKTTAANNGGDGIPVPVTATAGALSSSSITTTTDTDTDRCADNINVDMLRQLHTVWLDYLWNLLGIDVLPISRNEKGSNSNKTKTKQGAVGATQSPLELVRSKLPKLLLQTTATPSATTTTASAVLELVGAKVRVQACTRHPARVGRTGILVQATADTYQIAGLGPGSVVPVLPATLQDATAIIASQTQSSPPTIQTWIIPKRGSRLELLLPVDPLANKHGTTVDPFSSSSSDQPQLCILLDSYQHPPTKIHK
jgi:hypothetical protein